MKFLRLGDNGKEIPAVLDKNGKFKNLNPHIQDLNSETLNFQILEKLKKIDLEKLDEIDQNTRIGSCIATIIVFP